MSVGESGLPSGLIRFRLPTSDSIHLSIYDARGRRVSQVIRNVDVPSGSLTWREATEPGTSLEPGVYFVSLFLSGSVPPAEGGSPFE